MASELCGSFRANKKNSEHQALLSDSLTGLEASSQARLLSTVKSLCRPKMKMSAFNKSKCLFFGGEDLKSCSNRLSRFPSSSEQHALRCGQVTVHGKGGKTRMLLVYPATWQMLMALRTKAMTDDSPYARRSTVRQLIESTFSESFVLLQSGQAFVGLFLLRHAHTC